MADADLAAPLLSSDHIVVTVHSSAAPSASVNPFRALGSDQGLSVPPAVTVDPFRNDTAAVEGFYEYAKIAVCLPVVVLRLVLFGLCLAVGYVATKVALEGWKDKDNPMPKWRSRVMWITRLCARCILFAFGGKTMVERVRAEYDGVVLKHAQLLLSLSCYQWIKRKGRPAPREVAPIIVSNHVSYIEPIFYFYELFATIVASESHDSKPFVGTIIRAMQVIYVNRFVPSSRRQAIREIKRRASCNKFPRVLLFPEGTTTNGKNLISFQLGAFIPGYPIQPVIVRYPHVHFDQSWGNVSLGKLMFRMFTQFHNFFEVEYLPVISPLDDKETAVHFRERTSRAIATAMNAIQTGHSYGDIMLHTKAQEAKMENPSCFMVEMAKVESLFHISSTEAVDFLDKFLAMNPDPNGRVQYHDFLRVLRLKACPLSAQIFAFIDVERSGTITFRQFLYGSGHVMTQPGFHQACEEAFVGCGGAVKAYIVERELRDFIQLSIPSWNEDEVHNLFMSFDDNNDGRIDKDDFLSCLRRNPLLIAFFIPQPQQNGLDVDGVREIL